MERAKEAKAKIQEDFDMLWKDAKALIQATAGDVDDNTREARERLRKTLDEAKSRFSGWEESVSQAVSEQADKMDAYVREKPYQTAGVTLLAGLFLGWLFSRK
ncbi:MAG: hypothetical protein PWQ57_974 [Desulfovibrionales bacterium]|jgi:ElaB/YqjD/DUF883 family membrane-anchored ribosome-binding protein|nr:hypothetical protein [Desulfovibrionales bacterium]